MTNRTPTSHDNTETVVLGNDSANMNVSIAPKPHTHTGSALIMANPIIDTNPPASSLMVAAAFSASSLMVALYFLRRKTFYFVTGVF